MKTCYISDPSLSYSKNAPFHPDRPYPEITHVITSEIGVNSLYEAFRAIFRRSGFDRENFDTDYWNPLGDFVKPGNNVVIKPNWVFDVRGREQFAEQLTTHGAFLRVVIDYVVIALHGKGKITICDAPLQSASFDGILQDNSMQEIIDVYSGMKGIEICFLDLRREEMILDSTMSKIVDCHLLPGDPAGYTEIDLGALSYLDPLCMENKTIRFTVGDYDDNITNENHRLGVHKYLIPNTVLASDVFINLPKMKTHKKTAITGALKNIIGINASKAYLAHCYRDSSGGDEFSSYSWKTQLAGYVDRNLKQKLPEWIWKNMRSVWKLYKRHVLRCIAKGKAVDNALLSSGGGWYGNRTLWRTIYDLNTIVFFADNLGKLQKDRQRNYLGIVDGIVACEGDGPLHGLSRKAGTIIMGDDPLAIDACMATRMGFDINKIPIISNENQIMPDYSFSAFDGLLDCINVNNSKPLKPFAAPSTWKGHVEKSD